MEIEAHCPYCGEPVSLWIDAVDEARYVEDCSVCCRPWEVWVRRDEDGEIHVHLGHRDE